MSVQLITKYYADVEKTIRYGGTSKETAVRTAFQNLLNDYAQQQNLMLIAELEYKTASGKVVIPDGTLKDALRLDWGYWESKDSDDDLEQEIVKKFRKGYPQSNILFEDGQTAILYQKADRINQCSINDPERLHQLLMQFTTYTRAEVRDFRDAIERFKGDLPQVLDTLRGMIEAQTKTNTAFKAASQDFLELCQTVINADVVPEDVNEMLIQHILTEEIFTTVFDDKQFHTENNISKELQKLEKTFFTGSTKRNTLDAIKGYYQIIKARAAEIVNHSEKQMFLKIIYENFYKAYSPKHADRLGIVYTPDEIVKFMIESTDVLLHRHFHKTLGSKNVEILDPATGTGTFVCDLIDYLPEAALPYKYKNEIHCNEVAILPYYIANLNIEATYKQKMGVYEEFKNICFVDTLDNVHALQYKDKQEHLFAISVENANRVKRQNSKKISVIIGNPPYNAKQENYNYQNANRFYKTIDEHIRSTYVKEGKAQNQITLFDMYVRFVRWASDRIDANGIIAFVSNSSFIDALAFDGYRKCIADEFSEIHIVNLKGNARTSGERRRREGGNVFSDEIRVGVAVYFMVKKEKHTPFKVFYNEIGDYVKSPDKKTYLHNRSIKDLSFETIIPKQNNWLNLTDNDFDELMPLMDKAVKAKRDGAAIFKVFSSGLKSQRDDWVYDFSESCLREKMQFFVEVYSKTLTNPDLPEKHSIKWDSELDNYRERNIKVQFDDSKVTPCLYRPFVSNLLYFDTHLNGRTYQWFDLYSRTHKNLYIAVNSAGNTKGFHALASDRIIDLHCTGDSQCLSLYYFDADGQPVENITDWALKRFRGQYASNTITKQDIFYYVYGVLHNPGYRKKYAQNLKREFPRVPFYEDFKAWRDWGKRLMELHIGYETVTPYALKRIERGAGKKNNTPSRLCGIGPSQREGVTGEHTGSPLRGTAGHQLPEASGAAGTARPADVPKPRLKADKVKGIIEIDGETSLTGVPAAAWEYRLGNRSAVEWVLEQYKESKPKDPTIREQFHTYRFADYKEDVIALIGKVTAVSVETAGIVEQMADA
jgi:predicted helicase